MLSSVEGDCPDDHTREAFLCCIHPVFLPSSPVLQGHCCPEAGALLFVDQLRETGSVGGKVLSGPGLGRVSFTFSSLLV